jgi:hypothetical protein
MVELGGINSKNFRRNSYLLTGIIFMAVIFSSGCLDNYEDEITIEYWAYYEETLNFSNITSVLDQNGILFNQKEIVISFSFSKKINNETIEPSRGKIWKKSWTTEEYPSEMMIELDPDRYPWVSKEDDYKSKLDKRKPILEDSLGYISTLIYNATGLWPVNKEYKYSDG